MVVKLDLPFPLISDTDRTGIIEPLGLADPSDRREIARPGLVLLAPGGEELWRFVSRDYADRLPTEEVVGRAEEQGWARVEQDLPTAIEPRPGPSAMPLEGLPYYLRGARFAALAMGLRHGHHDPSIKEDSKAYVALMDSYIEEVRELIERGRSAGGS